MKFQQTALVSALCFGSLFCVVADVPAQKVKSSTIDADALAEVIAELNSATLPLATIGLESNVTEPGPDVIPDASSSYYQMAIFAPGFELARMEGCKLIVSHPNVSLLSFSTKYPDPTKGNLAKFRKQSGAGSAYRAEITIPLSRLKQNKRPFIHTKNAEKQAALGTWRTEFKKKIDFFWFPTPSKVKEVADRLMLVEITDDNDDTYVESMAGDEITFTFKEKESGEEFYALLGKAIALCRE